MKGPADGKMDKSIVFFGIGFELVALCIGGYVLGQYIDEYKHWNNFASTYLVLVLMIGWFVHLIYLLRRFENENDFDNEPKT